MCFKCLVNVSKPKEKDLNPTGKTFQLLGPATAKALKPQSVQWLGTTMSPWAADFKADRPCRHQRSRDLHGITDRGNRGITAVKTAVMGTGFPFYRGSGGNGDSCSEINTDYRDKTAVAAVMGTISVAKYCVRGWFLVPMQLSTKKY